MQPALLQCAPSEFHTDSFIYVTTIVLAWCPLPLTERDELQNTYSEQDHKKNHFLPKLNDVLQPRYNNKNIRNTIIHA